MTHRYTEYVLTLCLITARRKSGGMSFSSVGKPLMGKCHRFISLCHRMRLHSEGTNHSLNLSQHGFPPDETVACVVNMSSLTGKDEPEILWASPCRESWTWRCQVCRLCASRGFLWFKGSQFGRDDKHERAVFAFTWCHLAGFRGIDVSLKLLEFYFFVSVNGKMAFWKMNFYFSKPCWKSGIIAMQFPILRREFWLF